MLARKAEPASRPSAWPPAGRGSLLWMRHAWRQLRWGATDTLFPPQCVLCGESLPHARRWTACRACRAALQPRIEPRCTACAMPLPQAGARCLHCRELSFPFEHAVALGRYEGRLREAVIHAKQAHHSALSNLLGRLMAAELKKSSLPENLIVTWVPTHWWRKLRRGYCAPEQMARAVAGALRLPCHPLLTRVRATRKQGTLSREERQANMVSAFRAWRSDRLVDPAVLLVDDVMTTGATLSAAGGALRDAGVSRLWVSVAARGTGN